MAATLSEMPPMQPLRAFTWPINPGRFNPDDDRIIFVPFRLSSMALTSIDKFRLSDINSCSKVEEWMGTGHGHASSPHLELHFISELLARMTRSRSVSVQGSSARDAESDPTSRFVRVRSGSPEQTSSSQEFTESQIGSLRNILRGVNSSPSHASRSAMNGASTPNSISGLSQLSLPTSSPRSYSGVSSPMTAGDFPWSPLPILDYIRRRGNRNRSNVNHLQSRAIANSRNETMTALSSAFPASGTDGSSSTQIEGEPPSAAGAADEADEEQTPSNTQGVENSRNNAAAEDDEERSHSISLIGDRQELNQETATDTNRPTRKRGREGGDDDDDEDGGRRHRAGPSGQRP